MSNLTTTTVVPVKPETNIQDDGRLVSVTAGSITVHTYVHVPNDGGDPYVVVEVNDDGGDLFKVYVDDGVVHDGTRVVLRSDDGQLWERDPLYFDGRWILADTLERVRAHGESHVTPIQYRDEVGLTRDQLDEQYGPLTPA